MYNGYGDDKLKKDIIIDGDKFQKEYKRQYRKELITDLVQGILLIVIALCGLFLGDALLLKLAIYIFPLFILTYAVNLFSMGLGVGKKNQKQAISFFIQAVIFAGIAIYIFLNPFGSLGFVLVVLGGIIIANAVIKMIYFPNYTPVGSIICGLFLMVFADSLIKFFYTIAMIIILMIGISKISKFIYSIKYKK